jgi:enamine deaminase RidA (YjgF/YER057c/UK114 family)
MIEQRLQALGLVLPAATPPLYNYVPVTVFQRVAYVSGQVPRDAAGAVLNPGKVGADVSVEAAQAAARVCVLQALSQLKLELGSFERIERALKLTGFVNAAAGFIAAPTVIDAASQLLIDVLGDAGKHARSALGVYELPRGSCIEIEFTFALRD